MASNQKQSLVICVLVTFVPTVTGIFQLRCWKP